MPTVTKTVPRTTVSSDRDAPRKLWYVSDRQIRTQAAARNAAQIAEEITRARSVETRREERELFAALHTCAFRVTCRTSRTPITGSQRTLWGHRWQIIRDHIAEKNLGLAHLMIRRFRAGVLDEDDLLSEAMYALGRGIERFNPWKGFRFSTYACNVITRSLSRRRHGEARYRNLFPVQHEASYDKPTPRPDVRQELCLERLRQALDRNLGELTDIEATIISRRFPRELESRQTFEEIGRLIGLSKERVRQIQNTALKKLREVLELDPVLK